VLLSHTNRTTLTTSTSENQTVSTEHSNYAWAASTAIDLTAMSLLDTLKQVTYKVKSSIYVVLNYPYKLLAYALTII